MQLFSRFCFHKETCAMLSVPVPCPAAALAAGRAQAERGGAVGQAQAELRGLGRSRGSRRAAGPGLRPGGNL